MTKLVECEIKGEIAVLTLNRPEKRNAISDKVIDELEMAVETASGKAKAAVLAGKGEHFCAGLDLAEHVQRDLDEAVFNSRRWHEVFDKIARGKIPFIAALSGAVVGGGLELAAAAQIRVAARSAFFALPEGQRGIFTGGGGSVRIARLITAANMTDMMLTGRVLNANEAYRINMFQYLVEDGAELEKAEELARAAAKNAPLSNFAVIHALPRIQEMNVEDGLYTESLISAITTASPEARARLNDFLEKRAPRLKPKK